MAENMIKLGGNIVLDGCDDLEPATLIILKKMVGNYARKISEKNTFDELRINLQNDDNNYKLEVQLKTKEGENVKAVEDNNLFFALNNVLKDFI